MSYCIYCYKSKINFKKLHKNNLVFLFGCSDVQDQNHIFTNSQPIRSQLNITEAVKYEYIFVTVQEKQQVMPTFIMMEEARKHMRQHLSRHSKRRFFCAVKTLVLKFCARKSAKNITTNHLLCVKHKE